MSEREALREAAGVYARREKMTPDEAMSAARSLAKRGIWSLRQIAAITDLSASRIARRVELKAERTGGRFSPESIAPLLKLIDLLQRDELDVFLIKEAVEAGTGTSILMVSRLTGMPESSVKWHYARAVRFSRPVEPDAVAA